MQVRHDELHWEAALEKLLHGFSLRLLVPEKYYKKALKLAPKDNETNYSYALFLENVRNKPSEAEKYYKKSGRSAPAKVK